MVKTTISVTVDWEAVQKLRDAHANISEVCNNAIWVASGANQFSKEQLADAEGSISDVLQRAAEAGKREKAVQQELLFVSDRISDLMKNNSLLGFEDEYRRIVEETKSDMPSQGSPYQKLAFWKEVLRKLEGFSPAPLSQEGGSE